VLLCKICKFDLGGSAADIWIGRLEHEHG